MSKAASVSDVLNADILVIGTSIDPHISAVLDHLSGDLVVCRFNVDEYPASHRLTVATGASATYVWVDTPVGSWNVIGCPVVWFRRLGKPGISPYLSEPHRRFAAGEAEEALNGALSLIKPKSWVNEYWATRRAATKLYQYSTARVIGLLTPDTLVSSDAHRAQEFIDSDTKGEFVYKTLHSPVIDYPDQQARGFVFTSRLDETDRTHLDRIQYAPAQFQCRIEVAFELRVTSVGKKHFAVRIDGAARNSRVRDWRADGKKLRHSNFHLPKGISDKLSSLLGTLNIEFGASDWIVTPNGEYVFLEVNPHGAWLWLEEELEDLPISEAVARFLEVSCQ